MTTPRVTVPVEPRAHIVWNAERSEAVIFVDQDGEPSAWPLTAADDAHQASTGRSRKPGLGSALAEAFYEVYDDDDERPIQSVPLSMLSAAPAPEGVAVEFPYQRTLNAIADAVTWQPNKVFGISVEAFQRSFNGSALATPAEAGEYQAGEFIGRQPVLCQHGSTDPNNLCDYCEGDKVWPGRTQPQAREVEGGTLDPAFVAWLKERDCLPNADDGTVEWADIVCALNDWEADLTQAREEAQPVAYDALQTKKGNEVWIRATVTDPCTSCCGVSVKTITGGRFHGYVKPADVQTTPPAPEAEKLRASDGDVWSAAGCPEETFTDAAAAFAAAIEWIEEGQKERPERLHRTRNLPDVWAIMLNGELSLFDTEAEALAALQQEGRDRADWTDNRAFSGLLRRAHRAATRHQMASGEITDAMRERYGTTHSDLDLDELIEPLDYGQGSTPSVADVDRLMSEAGFPLSAAPGEEGE